VISELPSCVEVHKPVGFAGEDARAVQAQTASELRRMLRERESDLRAAMGEAQAGRAQVKRLTAQLQAVTAKKEELHVAKVALEEKLAAPVLSESAQRYCVLVPDFVTVEFKNFTRYCLHGSLIWC
jgi:hypothetical protein